MSQLEHLFLTSLNSHSLWMVFFAFLGGIVSSLLPCTVGMLPVLVGYVGGYTEPSKLGVLRQILLFMVGFSLILTLLGIAVSVLGLVFGTLVGSGWYYVVGGIAVLMGLQLLGWIQLPIPQFITRLPESQSGKILTPILLGMAFGAASSPCGTPFLTAMLGFISKEQNLLLGGVSLFAYALGQSMLLLVVGLFTGLIKHMATLRRVGSAINLMSGFLFILAGVLFIAQGAGWLDILAFF